MDQNDKHRQQIGQEYEEEQSKTELSDFWRSEFLSLPSAPNLDSPEGRERMRAFLARSALENLGALCKLEQCLAPCAPERVFLFELILAAYSCSAAKTIWRW